MHQCLRNLREHRSGARADRRTVEREGHVARHVEDELVAGAHDVDVGARSLFAQLLFLLVHVIADACPGDGTDASADDFRSAAVPTTDQIAEQIACSGAQNAADRGFR